MNGWWFRWRVRRHLQKPLDEVTVIETDLLYVDLPNVHRALEVWSGNTSTPLMADLPASSVAADSHGKGVPGMPPLQIVGRVGIPVSRQIFDSIRDARLFPQAIRFQMTQVAPHKRVRVPTAVMYFVEFGGERILIWNEPQTLMVAGVNAATVEKVIELIAQLTRQHSCYRGQVLSVSAADDYYSSEIALEFHEMESVSESEIVLPEETVGLLRRSTLDFFRVADKLIAMGQPGSRGLLLHGPPGTGKTLVTRWLIGHLPNVTKFLLTGQQLVHLERTVRLARMLRPSLLILDDVDLIATHRESNPYGSVLHDLMNLMDGLERQDQVMFLLTTNRPEQIESALSDRPGRVDQAIQFPLPDAHCRARLIKLFAGNQSLEQLDVQRWVRDSERTTPAFLRELVRRSTQCALIRKEQDAATEFHLRDEDFQAALTDMTAGGGSLTQRLLGFGHG